LVFVPPGTDNDQDEHGHRLGGSAMGTPIAKSVIGRMPLTEAFSAELGGSDRRAQCSGPIAVGEARPCVMPAPLMIRPSGVTCPRDDRTRKCRRRWTSYWRPLYLRGWTRGSASAPRRTIDWSASSRSRWARRPQGLRWSPVPTANPGGGHPRGAPVGLRRSESGDGSTDVRLPVASVHPSRRSYLRRRKDGVRPGVHAPPAAVRAGQR
jgi:hypothetical protein